MALSPTPVTDGTSPDVLLLGPGPSPVDEATRQAQARPLLGHLDPDFLAVMDRVQDDLRRVFQTGNRFTMPISGTGSAGMEVCLSNLVEPGDRVVVGVNGVFGGRMVDLAERLGADVVAVRADFGRTLDVAAMAEAIQAGDTRLVAFVHAETSTGVLQPPEEIVTAARNAGALVVLDCVTSLGGVAVDLDGWRVDAAFSGTQKCLSVPPGLAPVSFSERALARVRDRRSRPPTWYLDVNMLAQYWAEGAGRRVYHHTAPVSMVFALAAGLEEVLGEGLAARFDRHRAVAAALYRGLAALGLECLVGDAALRTPMLTSVKVPEDIDEAQVRRTLRERERIEIGGGLGPLQGRAWRIGLMGHGARMGSVTRVISALGGALRDQGLETDTAAAVAAAESV